MVRVSVLVSVHSLLAFNISARLKESCHTEWLPCGFLFHWFFFFFRVCGAEPRLAWPPLPDRTTSSMPNAVVSARCSSGQARKLSSNSWVSCSDMVSIIIPPISCLIFLFDMCCYYYIFFYYFLELITTFNFLPNLTCFAWIGYIGEFEQVDDHRSGKIVVQLNGRLNKTGVISPRFSVQVTQIESWVNLLLPSRSFGIMILVSSTVHLWDRCRSKSWPLFFRPHLLVSWIMKRRVGRMLVVKSWAMSIKLFACFVMFIAPSQSTLWLECYTYDTIMDAHAQ